MYAVSVRELPVNPAGRLPTEGYLLTDEQGRVRTFTEYQAAADAALDPARYICDVVMLAIVEPEQTPAF